MDALEPAAVPETIGPYRIERRLGAGGMGEVYLAYDPRLDRRVAVKRLRRDRANPLSRARLRREARAVARLSHPSIVHLFDLLELEAGEWLVMEHVDGPSLAEVLRSGPLGLAQVLTYGRQVAEGLAQAHARGVVHRDLKAENVVIAPAEPGGPGQARILDFGLVRRLAPKDDEETLTDEGTRLGTVRAMSPEQVRGDQVDPRSDLFSLGVLLYEMLTCRSPFRAASSAETLRRIVGQPPEPLGPEVPAELTGLVAQLLEKVPELRPADATTVARRLGRLADQLTAGDQLTVGAGESRVEASEETEISAAVFAGNDPIPARRPPWVAPAARPALGILLIVVLGISAGLGLRERDPLPSSPPTSPAAVRNLEADAAAALDEEGWEALARYDLEGNIDRAIELFQHLVEDAPDSARAHAGLARAYYRKLLQDSGDRMWRDQALSVGRRAVELDGGNADARVSLGLVLVQAGRAEEARRELERALEIEAHNADAHRGLSDVELEAGRLDAAEAALRRAVELRPGDRELHDLLGSVYFRAGRLAEAEAAFRRSVELAPDSVLGYRNLAGLLITRGQLDEAAAVLARAIEIRPSATLYLNQGTVFFYQGLYPRAAAAYESALDFPFGANFHVTWGNLGDAWRQIPHRRREAPEAFRQAIRLLAPQVESQDDTGWLRSQLALYRAKAGQREKALQEIRRVTATDSRPLFRLVVACEVLGERERALELLARALAAGFQPAEVEREPELVALRSDPRYHRLVTPADP